MNFVNNWIVQPAYNTYTYLFPAASEEQSIASAPINQPYVPLSAPPVAPTQEVMAQQPAPQRQVVVVHQPDTYQESCYRDEALDVVFTPPQNYWDVRAQADMAEVCCRCTICWTKLEFKACKSLIDCLPNCGNCIGSLPNCGDCGNACSKICEVAHHCLSCIGPCCHALGQLKL